MRERTARRKTEKAIKKEVKKQNKAIFKEMIDNKKDLMEVFGLTATLAMKLEEFEKDADFAIAGKAIKTVYTKMKNDLGRLFFEIKKRQEDMLKLALIRDDVAIITRAKLISKFDELKKKEEQYMKIEGKKEYKTCVS